MCLNVSYIPATKNAGLVVPGIKIIKCGHDNRWETPFIQTIIKDGWLFADRPTKRKIYDSDCLCGEVVHSYTKHCPYITVTQSNVECLAIGVIAYNANPDKFRYAVEIGSLAIYIPCLGNLPTVQRIRRVLNVKRPNKTMLYGIHPTLTELLKKYW